MKFLIGCGTVGMSFLTSLVDNISDWKLVNVMLKKLGDETNYSRVAKVLGEISKKVPGYQEIDIRLVGNLGCNREKVTDEVISICEVSFMI